MRRQPLRWGIDHHVKAMVAGAAPPAPSSKAWSASALNITHVYSLTETWPGLGVRSMLEWDICRLNSARRDEPRQGRALPHAARCRCDPRPWNRCPGRRRGDHGRCVHAATWCHEGYLKTKPPAPGVCRRLVSFWRPGRLARDGYIKIKDRSKGRDHLRQREHLGN